MRKLTFIERWGVVSLLIVGAIYGYLTYYRDNFVKEHANLVKKNNGLVKTLNETVAPENIDAIEKSTQGLQKELTALNKRYNEIKEVRITDKAHEEETVMRINELAAYLGLQIGQMGPFQEGKTVLYPQVQSEQKLLNRILYQVKLTGSFASLYEFANEIKTLPTVVNITNVNIQRNKDRGNLSVDLLFIL
ncbi:MAG: type 4a pilus biogenesis protein PilO [Pseudomonadota bacterium]